MSHAEYTWHLWLQVESDIKLTAKQIANGLVFIDTE
jgi:hypothetical protein